MRLSRSLTAIAISSAVACVLSIAPTPKVDAADAAAKPSAGVLPVGKDGQPLNLDFETGTLKDWTATGDAFNKQPIKGDTVFPRRSDMKSQHQGDHWIGGFEIAGDKPTGTLTSVPFKVTHPWASFLIGGGPQAEVRVEIVRTDNNAVIFKASGWEQEENLYRAAVDLREQQGKEIFIRLVDAHDGHWGHINFDDFRFQDTKPEKTGKPNVTPVPPADVVKNAGLSAEDAVKEMTLPEGFKATVFASEPAVQQPVAMAIDDRGRIWVAEAYEYPRKKTTGPGKDRIVILEDTDGDGKHDKRTIFMEGLNLVSGMEVGFGGVFVGAAPELLFIPDKDGDDKPDGPPQVLLDGWHLEDTHETLNSFNWGPDGWLYGCHGVFTQSRVGKPGTPDNQRTPINAAIWRYHPVQQTFEIFAEGGSNQWGVDFNDRGQAFMTACVIPHLYHVIQGARYERQAGKHFNPYIYADIKTIADHFHYAGDKGPHAGNNRSDAAGGGHAHCGALIYLGDSFPAEYRDVLFMGNVHGNRFNTDILEAKGSGYIGHHGKDFLKTNDKWSRPISMKYGPDGSTFWIDWYDKQPCHLPQPEVWDRSNGRVYKITYKDPKPAPKELNIAKMSNDELTKLQSNPNDWYVRHARRVLQERGGDEPARTALAALLPQTSDVPKHLRALWALHAIGGVTEAITMSELKNADPYVRGWAIQLACEDKQGSSQLLTEFARLANADPSPVVRLYLASALQRLPAEQRWDILAGLVKHDSDAGDHNLPLMVWYALEPLAGTDPARALKLAATSKLPKLAEYTARRAAAR